MPPLISIAVGAGALFPFADELKLLAVKPPGEFEQAKAPAAPDYNDLANWPAHPDRQDVADQVPAGEPAISPELDADVFYIHPTGYVRAGNWNSDMDPDRGAALMTQVWLATQASAFNRCCRIYAPEYRQAAIYAFADRKSPSGQQALELAYGDVLRAFDHYLEQENQGRPIILVAHSQGTAHAMRLLQERIDGKALAEQLVAAYLVGFQLPLDSFGAAFDQLQPCQGATDIGCILAWNTFREGYQWPEGVPQWYQGRWEWSDDKPLLCTNPLSWQVDQAAVPAEQNLGALAVELDGVMLDLLLDRNPGSEMADFPALRPEHTGAACNDQGILEVPEQTVYPFNAGQFLLGKGNYHISDFSLFYKNIQHNAMDRVAQFQALAALSSVDGD